MWDVSVHFLEIRAGCAQMRGKACGRVRTPAPTDSRGPWGKGGRGKPLPYEIPAAVSVV